MTAQTQKGRPGIPYEKFVEVWEQLIEEGKAGTNAIHELIGGSKSTIAAYRERYEQEHAAKELSILKEVQLPSAVQKAIAELKLKEINVLENENKLLKVRIDEHLSNFKKSEEAYDALKSKLETVELNFTELKKNLEQKIAIAESRLLDTEKRENRALEQCKVLSDQVSQYKQEAAVAKKEVEMLREQNKHAKR
ncbi:hypothetical protein [Facilibium subflavum]|uniref:hypothetical protein n=1 Tax=Facilibium subflavum TaxID=2219058 RepID=UPI000E648262|nr:hypothetical protein [Facilibium subflavum]